MNLQLLNNKIKQINGKLYLVGGIVRDQLLNIESHDIDLVVVGVTQQDFQNIFPDAKLTGKLFPVYRIKINNEEVEIAFARKERKISTGHNGFEMIFDPTVTLKDDLYRRDLTINALAQDIDTHEIIDYFGGIKDLHNKNLHAVSEHFCEDPLRVLRTARFAAKFNFNVDDYTYRLMYQCNNELQYLPDERIVGELEKVFQTNTPSIFFNILEKANVISTIFPFYQDFDLITLDKVKGLQKRFVALMSNMTINIINSLSSAYPTKWKKLSMIMNQIDIYDNEKILNTLLQIRSMNNTSIINDISEIYEKKFNQLCWFLNENVYNKVIHKIFNIPPNMSGDEIKNFVRLIRLQILEDLQK